MLPARDPDERACLRAASSRASLSLRGWRHLQRARLQLLRCPSRCREQSCRHPYGALQQEMVRKIALASTLVLALELYSFHDHTHSRAHIHRHSQRHSRNQGLGPWSHVQMQPRDLHARTRIQTLALAWA